MNRSSSPSDPLVVENPRPSLWRSGLHTWGMSVVSIPLSVLTNIVVARALGPDGKGSYELVLATAALLGIVLGFSLPVGVTFVVARRRCNLRTLAARLIGLALMQGVIAAILLYAIRFTHFSSALLPADLGNWVIAAIGVLLVFTEMSNYWRAMLMGRQEIIRANWRDFISRMAHLLFILFSIGLLTTLGQKASAAVLIWISVAIAIFKNPLFLEALRAPFRRSSGASGLPEVVGFALPCYLANLTQFLNYRLDVFFVSFFAGVNAVGLYTLAVTLAQVIWLLPSAAAAVLLPRIAASPEAKAESAMQTARATRLVLWISVTSALIVALFAHLWLTWVFGEAFRGSIPALSWLLPGIAFFSAASVMASYLAGIGKPRLNLYTSLGGLVVTVALNLLLIPRLNIIGAAISSSASYSITTLLMIWFFIRESGMPLCRLLIPTAGDLELVMALGRSMLNRHI